MYCAPRVGGVAVSPCMLRAFFFFQTNAHTFISCFNKEGGSGVHFQMRADGDKIMSPPVKYAHIEKRAHLQEIT